MDCSAISGAGQTAWVNGLGESNLRSGSAPSAPSWRADKRVSLRHGVFGPDEYCIVSHEIGHQSGMPALDAEERAVALSSLGLESRLARDERRRGIVIVISHIRCPLLTVTGERDVDWPRAKYDGLRLPAEHVRVEGCSHWGLVLNRRAVAGTGPVRVALDGTHDPWLSCSWSQPGAEGTGATIPSPESSSD